MIEIVEAYPEESPNAILRMIDCGIHYSMEHFESNLRVLDYQIEDYKRIVSNSNGIGIDRKAEIEIENREYAKKKILEIRDKYYDAQERYRFFGKSNKAAFELLAGQEVKNRLVEFEVARDNIFIAGQYTENDSDPVHNRIIIVRENLIQSMRDDMERVRD